MMIQVNRVNDKIFGSVNGKSFSVSFTEEKYKAMTELEAKANSVATMDELREIVAEFEPLTEESYKEVVETVTPYIHVNRATNKFHLKWNGVISKRTLPNSFAERLIQSVEKGIDIMPLLKCWVRYQRPAVGKPAYDDKKAQQFADYISAMYVDENKVSELMRTNGLSHEKATEIAAVPQVMITQEGLIVTFKVSKEIRHKYSLNENEEVVTKSRYEATIDPDTGIVTYNEPTYSEDLLFEPVVMGKSGDDFHSVGNGQISVGHLIRVGCSHYLDSWSKVSAPGYKGLHCGSLYYIKGYQTEGTVTHNVFVDPADIHSVAMGGEHYGALTTKRYFVFSSFKGVNKNIYHSSTYAALNDAEFQKELEILVNATKQDIATKEGEIDELNSLG
jgi:hypothetical protein